MSTPLVPPRPNRTHGENASSKDAMPQIPPRPARKQDPSPNRDFRSPLNELPNPLGLPKGPPPSNLSTEVPARPPSVSLPSIGQEGSEYVTYDQLPPEAHGVSVADNKDVGTPEHTSNVSETVPLHAPRASVSNATAKSRIATVTSTDSTQAAAAGIGKAKPADDVHLHPETGGNDELRRVHTVDASTLKHDLSAKRSTPNFHHGSRPASVQEGNHELGIPQIGSQIPLYPNAGDVQAPSPAQIQSMHTPGVGFFNDGSSRAHQRRRSAKYEFGPPGSYGLHSHTHEPHDQFERDWYAKNPEKAALEGHYGRPTPVSALSSAQLNRLVTQTDDSGSGVDPGTISTPGEEIGWTAAEEYVSRSRAGTPSATPLAERTKRTSSGSQPAVESLLRRKSYPFNAAGQGRSEGAIDDGTIHINMPERRASQIEGGDIADGGIDLGPHGGNTAEEGGFWEERGAGTPILASDEVLKRPGSAYMLPAVESHEYDDELGYHDSSRRSSLRVPSRPSSRPNSMHGDYHGGNLYRFMSHDDHHGSGVHTPLEEIEEYEPLIPEDDPEPKPKPKMVKRLRPGLEHHHFPSQDTWEDTPTSLQYHTTVGTPDLPRETARAGDAAKVASSGTTDEEQKKAKVQSHDEVLNQKKAIKAHYAAEHLRPGVQRFPSKDIWEDTPSSMQYVTTVGGPQMDESRSPPDDRPTTTAIPGSQDESDARATTAGGFKPVTPNRAHRRSKLAEEIRPDLPDQQRDEGAKELPDLAEEKPASPEKAKAPAIPDRPKPTIPQRPARSSRAAEKSVETPAEAPPVAKTKPAVPARPVGEKIASLKAGFMNDLNSRLKIGPPKAKEPEPEAAEETEKAPLEDARKSRAKGPARRKPAASPAAMAEATPMAFSLSTMQTVWHIGDDGKVNVPDLSGAAPDEVSTIERVLTDNADANTHAAAPPAPASEQKTENEVPQPSKATQAPSSSLETDLSPPESISSPPPAQDVDQKIYAAITTLSDESDKTKEEVTVDTEKPVAEGSETATTTEEAQPA